MKKFFTGAGYLTPRETELIGRLSYEKKDILTESVMEEYMPQYSPSARSKIIFRLAKKGLLKKIKKNLYYYSPIEAGPQGRDINPMLVPALFFPKGNYYVGYSTAYNFYGFTDQIFQVIYVLNTSIQRDVVAGGTRIKFRRVSPKRIYGFAPQKLSTQSGAFSVNMSDRERTLVDLLYFPAPVGGAVPASVIFKTEAADKKTNVKKLIEYLKKFPSVSTIKRAGYLLEQAGISAKKLLPRSAAPSLATLYGGKNRSGRIDTKWGLIINDTQK
jgi:predicted transcriptional regulator of viral defense system